MKCVCHVKEIFVGIRTELELSGKNWKFEKLILHCDLTVPKDISDEIVGDSNECDILCCITMK